MTGKQLRAWAATLHDEAVVSVRERAYGEWNQHFQIKGESVWMEKETEAIAPCPTPKTL